MRKAFIYLTIVLSALFIIGCGNQKEAGQDSQKLDVSDYYTGYEVLVDRLSMEPAESWQMSDDSYVSDGFYLEFNADDDICSMKNEGNPDIAIEGIYLGTDMSEACSLAEENGWVEESVSGSSCCYMKQSVDQSKIYLLQLSSSDGEKVSSWYWNNWPQGDFLEFFEEQGWKS